MSVPVTFEVYWPQITGLQNRLDAIIREYDELHSFIFSPSFGSGSERDFVIYESRVSRLWSDLVTTGNLVGAQVPSAEAFPPQAAVPPQTSEWKYIATIAIVLGVVALAYVKVIDPLFTFLCITVAVLGLSGPELLRELKRLLPLPTTKQKQPKTWEDWIGERMIRAMRLPAAAFNFLGPYMLPLVPTWRKKLQIEVSALLAQVMGVTDRAVQEQIRFLNEKVAEVTKPAPAVRRGMRPTAPIAAAAPQLG